MATQQDQLRQGAPRSEAVPMTIDAEKQDASHKEFEGEVVDDEKKQQATDYSGAAKKTDPAEIKLVRKLDLWIMVSPPLRRTHPANAQNLHTANNSPRYGSCTG